jgi:hypothetical protein
MIGGVHGMKVPAAVRNAIFSASYFVDSLPFRVLDEHSIPQTNDNID